MKKNSRIEERAAAMKDVAKAAGCALSTVYNQINRRKGGA